MTPDDRFALCANAMLRDVYPGRANGSTRHRMETVPADGRGGGAGDQAGRDGDTLFWLTELGVGGPELGAFSLAEIARIRLPFDLYIERDLSFESVAPPTVWVETVRRFNPGSGIAVTPCRSD